MHLNNVIHTVDSHTEGNPTRVVLSGFGVIPGSTLLEKRDYVQANRDDLRRLLLHEPRGGALNCAVLLLDPCDSRADVSAIIMEQAEYVPMCGHCIIGLATTLVELGLVVARTEPQTQIVIETPSGLVTALVEVGNRRTGAVTLRNVPSFLTAESVPLQLADGRNISADISFGGDFYICVEAKQLGIELSPHFASEIEALGRVIREAARDIKVVHPARPDLDRAYMVMFYEELSLEPIHYRNVIVAPPGMIDRSPCGTGTSAALARLVAQGKMSVGDTLVNEGILGTSFRARAVERVELGEVRAVVPEITGRAYITGFHQWVLDPEDPFPAGYLLG
jgi:proline racemase